MTSQSSVCVTVSQGTPSTHGSRPTRRETDLLAQIPLPLGRRDGCRCSRAPAYAFSADRTCPPAFHSISLRVNMVRAYCRDSAGFHPTRDCYWRRIGCCSPSWSGSAGVGGLASRRTGWPAPARPYRTDPFDRIPVRSLFHIGKLFRITPASKTGYSSGKQNTEFPGQCESDGTDR